MHTGNDRTLDHIVATKTPFSHPSDRSTYLLTNDYSVRRSSDVQALLLWLPKNINDHRRHAAHQIDSPCDTSSSSIVVRRATISELSITRRHPGEGAFMLGWGFVRLEDQTTSSGWLSSRMRFLDATGRGWLRLGKDANLGAASEGMVESHEMNGGGRAPPRPTLFSPVCIRDA